MKNKVISKLGVALVVMIMGPAVFAKGKDKDLSPRSAVIFACLKVDNKVQKFPASILVHDLLVEKQAGQSTYDATFIAQLDTGAPWGYNIKVKLTEEGKLEILHPKTSKLLLSIDSEQTEVDMDGTHYSECEMIDPLSD